MGKLTSSTFIAVLLLTLAGIVWFNLKSSERVLTLFTQIKYDTVKQYSKMYKELDTIIKTTDINKLDGNQQELDALKPDFNSQNRRNR